MAAYTLATLNTEIQAECQELMGQTDLDSTRIDVMANRGYRQFIRDTKSLSKAFDFTTVANQQFYTSSDTADWVYAFEIIDVKYVIETSEFGKELYPYPGGYNKLPRNKAYGEPTHYYTFGSQGSPIQKIGTYPIIDAVETLSVNAYHNIVTELTGVQEPLISDEYREAIVYYAVWRLFKNYGHQNSDYRRKALDNKALYDEVIKLFKFDNFSIDQLHQVYNVNVEQ